MFSRRHFLQLAGISLASAALPAWASAPSSPDSPLAPTLETVYGRAFQTTRVYAAPTLTAPITQRLWANTVTPILDSPGDWYRLPQGYVLRRNMQPLFAPAQHSETTFQPPFWAEVSGAVGIVHQTCDAHSTIVRRIGHGGVLRVIDWLPGTNFDWYGVSDDEMEDHSVIGWTQASIWSPVQEEAVTPALTLAVDLQAQQLTVRDGDRALLTAPISTNGDLHPGRYSVSERRVSQPNFYYAEPWRLNFGTDHYLSGVYWHNQFGKPARGAAVQVTPPLARWLYARAAEVIVY